MLKVIDGNKNVIYVEMHRHMLDWICHDNEEAQKRLHQLSDNINARASLAVICESKSGSVSKIPDQLA